MKHVLLFSMLILFGCASNEIATSVVKGDYTIKVSTFRGNKYNKETFDSTTYDFIEEYTDGLLIKRYHPNYVGGSQRTERFSYDNEGKILKEYLSMNRSGVATVRDSMHYIYSSPNAWKVKKFSEGNASISEEVIEFGDTILKKQFIMGSSMETQEIWTNDRLTMASQIIAPVPINVINTYSYDKHGNTIKIENDQGGKRNVISTWKNEYDQYGRLILRQKFMAGKNDSATTEVRIYSN